ncbi:MraY family glycosyltransferase [Salinimicrobium catena]|uniref:MraY family glycosyltransferase n=1 Tax=Salinimicrobium catena TaxID=390640 RepID=UPI002FE4F6C1
MNILDQEVILEFFRSHYELFIGSVFLITFGLTYYLIPKVIWVSNQKDLMATVNAGSVHKTAVPAFGGVAFFISLMLVLSIVQTMRLSLEGNHLIAAITLLFMVGLRDDMVESSAKVKLLGQMTAAMFLIFSPALALENLHGFLGEHAIHPLLGLFIKLFIVIALINAYNLIDGIDGLAGATGMIISATFGFIFYTTGHSFDLLVSISILGVLAAFLRFNFSRKKKIFMGDSGSMVIGLLLAFLSIKFLAMEPKGSLMTEGYSPANRLLFLACILFLPIFDTLRVILVRLKNGSGLFTADRNHSYHVLLDLGLSHRKASLVMGLMNLGVIVFFLQFSRMLPHLWLVAMVVAFYASAFVLFGILKSIAERRVSSASKVVTE